MSLAVVTAGCMMYVPYQLDRVTMVDKRPVGCELLDKIDSAYNPDNDLYGFTNVQDAIDYIRLYTVSMDGDTAWIEKTVKSTRPTDGATIYSHIAYAYKCEK